MIRKLARTAASYDQAYARSLRVPDQELLISLDKLFLNYGVLDPVRDRDSERLPMALGFLDFGNLGEKIVLDYGCGSAKASVVLAQAGARVFGFDLSLNSIKTGIRRSKVNRVNERVHLAVMSAGGLALPSDFFDFVFGYEVLYYLNDQIEFAGEILRVLKPGGRAIFCEALGGNPVLQWVRRALRRLTGTVNRTAGRALTPWEIQRAFGEEGQVATYPVNLLAMGKRLLPWETRLCRVTLALLKRIDLWLLTRFPQLRQWCGEVVIVITKPALR